MSRKTLLKTRQLLLLLTQVASSRTRRMADASFRRTAQTALRKLFAHQLPCHTPIYATELNPLARHKHLQPIENLSVLATNPYFLSKVIFNSLAVEIPTCLRGPAALHP